MNIHVRYASYLIRHKWFVFQAGLWTKASLWRLIKHDWSKLLPSEWVPYARYFYADPPIHGPYDRPNHTLTISQWKDSSLNSFNKAWLLHQRRNDHHWQYWVLNNDDGSIQCLPMPEKVWREMVADWMGAGRAITGRWECGEWYAKNRENIQLHPETRALVELEVGGKG